MRTEAGWGLFQAIRDLDKGTEARSCELEAEAQPEGLEVSETINLCTQPHPALER